MRKSERPNILFVFADQMRGSSMGHVGQEPIITPNLDAFASQGIRFNRAVSNSPLCCPARATLLTGLHAHSHDMVSNDLFLRDGLTSIAHVLGNEGYRTGYIGKWHLDGPDRGGFTPPGPRRLGFDYWAAYNCHHFYYEPFYFTDSHEPIWTDEYEPHTQTNLAINYLKDSRNHDQPFCLFLSWSPPHCPYEQVPDNFKAMYEPESMPLRPNVKDPNRRIIADYYAQITALDWEFGRLLRAVDDLDLAENTLVIFTSDHGDMMFSHGHGWKCKPWSESTIVPFIARWPGRIPAGAEESAPFGLVDVMPTLLSICGAEIPSHVEGIPLPQMLLGEPSDRPESQFIYHFLSPKTFTYPEWRGVITQRHTYARFRDRAWLLYDDIEDLYQLNNLVDNCENQHLQTEMDHELNRWLEKLGDPFESSEDVIRQYRMQVDRSGTPFCYYRPEIIQEVIRRSANRPERMAKMDHYINSSD